MCEDRTACPMHNKWRPIKDRIVALLRQQTLASLARAVLSGKYRLSDVPAAMLAEEATRKPRTAA